MIRQEEHSSFIRQSARDYDMPVAEVQKAWNSVINEKNIYQEFYKKLEAKLKERTT